MTFKDYLMETAVIKYLMEYPPIEFAKDKSFDLEVETFKKKPSIFLTFLDKILDGFPTTDKYSSTIILKSKENKKTFIDNVENNYFIQHWLKNTKLTDQFNELINKHKEELKK